MSQYGVELNFGRRGISVDIFRMDDSGGNVTVWQAMLNGKGIRSQRVDSEGKEVVLSEFDSFLYPDAVEEEEIDLSTMLSGPEFREDRAFLRLCSLLVAKWEAGHNEESCHEVVRNTVRKWSEETT